MQHFNIVTIPRARKVLQPLSTVPITALISLYTCLKEVTLKPLFNNRPFGDLLLLNGPGTCVPLFMAVFINRVSTSNTSFFSTVLISIRFWDCDHLEFCTLNHSLE